MADEGWPRIVDEQYGGDPFVKLVECDGKHYLFDEAALIEQEERTYAEFARSLAFPRFQASKED